MVSTHQQEEREPVGDRVRTANPESDDDDGAVRGAAPGRPAPARGSYVDRAGYRPGGGTGSGTGSYVDTGGHRRGPVRRGSYVDTDGHCAGGGAEASYVSTAGSSPVCHTMPRRVRPR